MNTTRYAELLSKLDCILLPDGSKPSVSPGGIKATGAQSPGLYITPDMKMEQLSKNDLVLAHALLHKLHATGTKTLTKTQIYDLHEEVSKRINHSYFDGLDD